MRWGSVALGVVLGVALGVALGVVGGGVEKKVPTVVIIDTLKYVTY